MFEELVSLLCSYGGLLIRGLCMTVALWIASLTLSCSLGLILGVLSCNKLKRPWFVRFIHPFVFFFRGTPVYVLVLMVYFVVPDAMGINLAPFPAAVLALGLCSSAYVTEIVRSGVNAVSPGQWDAGFALGFSTWDTLRYIVLPQGLGIAFPIFLNEAEATLKSTSIVATIGVLEITRVGQNIVAREMNPVMAYTLVAALYLLLSYSLGRAGRYVERTVR